MRSRLLVSSAILCAAANTASMMSNEPVPETVDAARAFLAALAPAKRSKASLPFNSPERLKWAYVPMARAGLPWKEMTLREREAALALLRAGLSEKGFTKVDTIRKLEDVLRAIEGWSMRDPELYYFSVFGEPSAKGAWGWRYEGHHISLHWTMLEGRVAGSAPQFLGANPAEVRDGALQGTRALAAEEDLGRALVKSLNQGQRAEAILADSPPSDILSSGARAAAIQEDRGIAWARLNPTQQGILLSLIQEYAATQTPAVARERLDEVRRGLSEMRFSWLGGLEPGQGHYYRIQGRAFLVEYDNTQNHANHIHSVWREFHGDWGEDVLAEHYRTSPHHADYRRAFPDQAGASEDERRD